MPSPSRNDHWLARPETVRLLWRGFLAILALTVLAELAIEKHPYFAVDGWLGFNAAFGFLACVGLIVVSKALSALLKRPDTYYED
jgi:hypothetical protein